jgi:hypothetical protein
MLITFLVSIIGIVSVIAQVEHLFQHRLIDEKTLGLMKFFSPPLIGLSVYYSIHSPLFLIIVFVGLIITPLILMIVHKSLRERRMQSRILPLLDQLILEVKGGTSLRGSLKICLSDAFLQGSWDLKEVLVAIIEKRAAPKGLSKKATWIYDQIQGIERAQLKQLDRLNSLRAHLRRQIRFKEKTRLASRQVETQVILCSLMYAALIAFTLHQYPEFGFHFLFWISVGLFISGIGFFLIIRRSFKCPL